MANAEMPAFLQLEMSWHVRTHTHTQQNTSAWIGLLKYRFSAVSASSLKKGVPLSCIPFRSVPHVLGSEPLPLRQASRTFWTFHCASQLLNKRAGMSLSFMFRAVRNSSHTWAFFLLLGMCCNSTICRSRRLGLTLQTTCRGLKKVVSKNLHNHWHSTSPTGSESCLS